MRWVSGGGAVGERWGERNKRRRYGTSLSHVRISETKAEREGGDQELEASMFL